MDIKGVPTLPLRRPPRQALVATENRTALLQQISPVLSTEV